MTKQKTNTITEKTTVDFNTLHPCTKKQGRTLTIFLRNREKRKNILSKISSDWAENIITSKRFKG